ncbi:MAG TPA: AmmeMemoRadiSam system protein A [Burkholderiales bacterium]|nr:AmmeMemoRadiSam system protein A [Burkholderiales bacterium]
MSRPQSDKGQVLLGIARAAIARRFGLWLEADEQADFLHSPAASFVTLKQEGRLRGCIGSLEPRRTLLEDVRANAQAAAFQDPRFTPLAPAELNRIDIEVSVLSALSPVRFRDERDAISELRAGEDGVVLAWRDKRGTFLPQVWESLPEPAAFLSELKRKAGLAAEFWAEDVRLYRYTVDKWSEA